jgi:hypothetical protein
VRHVSRYIKCEGCEKFYVFSITLSLVCGEGQCVEMIMHRCSVLSSKVGRGVSSVLSRCVKSSGLLLKLAGRGSDERRRRSEAKGRRLVDCI